MELCRLSAGLMFFLFKIIICLTLDEFCWNLRKYYKLALLAFAQILQLVLSTVSDHSNTRRLSSFHAAYMPPSDQRLQPDVACGVSPVRFFCTFFVAKRYILQPKHLKKRIGSSVLGTTFSPLHLNMIAAMHGVTDGRHHDASSLSYVLPSMLNMKSVEMCW